MQTPIYAEYSGSSFEPAPIGSHVAICYGMIELGTQPSVYKGQPKQQKKVRLMFELCNELKEIQTDNGVIQKPLIVFREFGKSMHEKAGLRLFLENWRGKKFTEAETKKFDITVLLGKSCVLTIQHDDTSGTTFANISSAAPLMKGMNEPTLYNKITCLSFEAFDWEVYNGLSEKTKDKIALSPEYGRLQSDMAAQNRNVSTALPQAPQSQQPIEDDLPF